MRRHRADLALTVRDGPRLSWEDYGSQVRDVAAALDGLGLRRGEVLGCWLSCRPEFHVADLAALHLGMTVFSVYDTATAEHLLRDSGARVLITEAAHVDAAIRIRAGRTTALEHIVLVEGDAPEALGWDELLEFARPGFDFDAAWNRVEPADVAVLAYTAGTTGPPKGVELSHANLTAQAEALADRLGLPEGIRTVALGPMGHITERLAAHYLPVFGGWEVVDCRDPSGAVEAIGAARPEFLCGPPHLWERLRAADGLGLAGLRAALATGGPCAPGLLAFWRERGVALEDAYGLSEASGVAAVAGTPTGACELRAGDDGILRVRGPAVARGYRHHPDPVEAGGWLRTGDAGELDGGGRLRLRRRPDHVEAELRAGSRLLAHACVVGDGRPYNVALLTLEPTAAHAFARVRGVRDDDLFWLAQSRRVIEAVQLDVRAANAVLAPEERVHRFLLLGREWPPGSDEVTPLRTVRRERVAAKYSREIEALYSGALGVEPG